MYTQLLALGSEIKTGPTLGYVKAKVWRVGCQGLESMLGRHDLTQQASVEESCNKVQSSSNLQHSG